MVRGTVAYALALLCAGAFYLFYPRYLSFYTLVLLLTLPLLSLVFTLLSRRRYALSATLDRPWVTRGEAACVRLVLRGPAGECLRFAYRLENLLYPQERREETVTLTVGHPHTIPLPTGHCGWLKLTPLSCRLPGRLGILSLSLPLPQPALVLVRPRPGVLPGSLDLSPQTGAPLRPRPGGGPGEEYELRPYRPGDPVSAIHWKLTAKQPKEEPILRETLEPLRQRLAVTYDHFGPPDALDQVLDQLQGLARRLIDKEDAFTLCWTHPTTGALTHYTVDCPQAWDSCYQAIAAQSAPPLGTGPAPGPIALPGFAGPVKRIHLTPDPDREEVSAP